MLTVWAEPLFLIDPMNIYFNCFTLINECSHDLNMTCSVIQKLQVLQRSATYTLNNIIYHMQKFFLLFSD